MVVRSWNTKITCDIGHEGEKKRKEKKRKKGPKGVVVASIPKYIHL